VRGVSSGGRRSVACLLAPLIAMGIAACSPTASPNLTFAPASPATSFGPSPSATLPPPLPLATLPGPTDPPFVAADVAVSLESFAKVDGGALDLAVPADGSNRLIVATQQGRIWSVANGAAGKTPLLDVSKRITSGGERGLLGIALHPGFPSDSRIFVDYTDLDGNSVVSSFDLLTDGSGRFDPSSESIFLQVDQPFPNHNGGGIAFGPDGFLYIALGDGGSGGDPMGNGQRLDTLLAKILRIDVDHPGFGPAYTSPGDNPFVGRAGAKAEIWLYGLRNPFRFSFDRSNGDLWIGDVGQNKWEEVDVVRAGLGGGQDFGWNVMEGAHCYQPADNCDRKGLSLPVAEYGHDQGCAIIGGFVYRGSAYPILRGGYLFSDSCSGTIWAIPAATNGPVTPVAVGEATGSPAGFGQDPAGELYLANLDGTVSRIVATSR
jgi:glucose/arabinose dehydrogenase